MEDNNPWIYESDRLEITPSFRDGISRNEEMKLRTDGVRFIQCLGNKELELHYCTVATGAAFFHRFYMFHSFRMFPIYPMAATCLFLAGKVEETPKKSNDIVKFSQNILNRQNFAQFGTDPKEEILTLERILLQTIRFDLEIEHPYDHLVSYVKHFVASKKGVKGEAVQREVLQSAWTFLNDSCCTTVSLQYEPEIVAVAVILLACKTGEFEVTDWDNRKPEHRYWWDAYTENLDELTLENICHQILDFYQYLNSIGSMANSTDEFAFTPIT